jgi:hypothetical protein
MPFISAAATRFLSEYAIADSIKYRRFLLVTAIASYSNTGSIRGDLCWLSRADRADINFRKRLVMVMMLMMA